MSKSDHTYPAGQAMLYNRYFEYERVVSNVSVTDEGIFKAGEVPTTYGGAQLDLQIVHAVFMVNSRGEMVMWEFDTEEGMDTNRERGGPVMRDGVQIRAGAGPSTVPITQTTIQSPNLDPSRKAIGVFTKGVFDAEVAQLPSQPVS